MSAVSLAIRALLAQSGVTAITSTRIRPFPLQQGESLPAIAVAMSSETEEQLLAGASQYPETSVQIQCIATKASDAIDLGEAVKNALRDRRSPPLSRRMASTLPTLPTISPHIAA